MIKLGMYGSYFGKDDPKTLPYVEDVIDFAYELKLDVVDFRAELWAFAHRTPIICAPSRSSASKPDSPSAT